VTGTLALLSAVATTSGTTVTIASGIPPDAKEIVIMFDGVSTNGATGFLVQLGDSGGFETVGYSGSCGDSATDGNHSTGFRMFASGTAAAADRNGKVVLTLMDASTNTWAADISVSSRATTNSASGSGTKSLSGTLTQIRIATTNGSDAFDAGVASAMIKT